MNIALWIAQGLMAFMFSTVGYAHSFNFEKTKAVPRMGWLAAVPKP